MIDLTNVQIAMLWFQRSNCIYNTDVLHQQPSRLQLHQQLPKQVATDSADNIPILGNVFQLRHEQQVSSRYLPNRTLGSCQKKQKL